MAARDCLDRLGVIEIPAEQINQIGQRVLDERRLGRALKHLQRIGAVVVKPPDRPGNASELTVDDLLPAD